MDFRSCVEETNADDPQMSHAGQMEIEYEIDQSSSAELQSAIEYAHATFQATEAILPPRDSGIVPKVHNVVSSVDMGCELNLLNIAHRLRNAEYNPKRFHAVIMRIREPKTAALIFRSGKIVVTGARSEQAANLAARKYAVLIQKLGYNVRFIDFKIQNMVASCDVKFPIQIENLYTNHCQFSRYEPELFPGLIYRLVKPKVVLLIFVSGKIVITGGKSREDIKESFEAIFPILKSFRKI